MATTTRKDRIKAHRANTKHRSNRTHLGHRNLRGMLRNLEATGEPPPSAAARTALLEKARAILKKEFFGIDEVIDRVIASFTGWFLFNQVQDRPFIINLWGLTGVGKTALVKRLTEILDLGQYTFRINLAEVGDREFNARNEIFNPISGRPAILILDEFQHFRTKTETGTEKEHKSFIWDLLDHGRIELFSVPDDYGTLNNMVKDMESALAEGVQIKRNRVVSGARTLTAMVGYMGFYHDLMHTGNYYRKFQGEFFPETFADAVSKVADGREGTGGEIYARLTAMDGHEIVAYLKRILKASPFTHIVDCSKNLIFVIGNLDELHRNHNDVDPDIDPDQFREDNGVSTLSEVKQALSERFRTEQIARLGNVHIVYPALNREAYLSIIERELAKIRERTHAVAGVKLTFDPSVVDFIFRDGVVPSQGTRPLFSTFHAHVGANVARLLTERELKGLSETRVVLRASGHTLTAEYVAADGILRHTLVLPVELHIEGDRKSPRDRLTALVALHEAGHATVAMAYFGIVPERCTAASAEHKGSGFTRVKRDRRGDHLVGIRGHIAIALGGPLAEQMFFGRDHMTQGCAGDLAMATKAAVRAVRRDGFGSNLARFSYPTNDEAEHTLLDRTGQVAKEAEKILADVRDLTNGILGGEKAFILALAREIFEKGTVRTPRIQELARLHGSPRLNGAPLFPEFDYRAELLRLTAPYAPTPKIPEVETFHQAAWDPRGN